MIKIYALVNPITKEVFYIGATKGILKYRLSQHISESKWDGAKSKKQLLIKHLLKKNKRPLVILLKEVDIKLASEFETFYYNYYKSLGYDLLQKKGCTIYTKVVQSRLQADADLACRLHKSKLKFIKNLDAKNKLLTYIKNA